jgi:hypothetical protein
MKGDLTVSDHLQYRNNGANDYIVEGYYQSKIKFKKNKISVKVKNEYLRSKISMDLPADVELPDFDLKTIHNVARENCEKLSKCDGDFVFKLDAFYLTAAQLDQPFDLHGLVLVHRKKSPEKTEFEACEILPNINECRVNFPNRNPYSFCREGAPGQRLVTYTAYDYDLDFELFFTQDNLKKANFNSNALRTFKEYAHIGACHPL